MRQNLQIKDVPAGQQTLVHSRSVAPKVSVLGGTLYTVALA